MRVIHPVLVLILTGLPTTRQLTAQHPPLDVAVGGGLLLADDGQSSYLKGRGLTGFLRASWQTVPIVLEASVQNVPRNRDVVSGPCLPAPATCPSAFLGPTTAVTLAPAIQATQRVPVAAWLFRLGPSVHWLLDREATADPFVLGVRAGISVRSGRGESGLLVSADYFRMLRGSHAPNWLLPITVGWQF